MFFIYYFRSTNVGRQEYKESNLNHSDSNKVERYRSVACRMESVFPSRRYMCACTTRKNCWRKRCVNG